MIIILIAWRHTIFVIYKFFSIKKNTGASGTSHLPQEEIDSGQTKITKVNVSDKQSETSAITIMAQSGKQASAGTDVDDPGVVLQEFQKLVLCIGK